VRTWALAWLAAVGCGRIGFDEIGAAADGPMIDDRLVAWYPMDTLSDSGGAPQSPGRPVRDATGRGHDGACDLARVIPPRCPTVTAGRADAAYHFDGQAMFLVDSAPDLLTTAGFTVTAWLRFDQQPVTRACAVTKGLTTGSYNSWALCVEPSQQLFFYTVAGTASDNLRSTAVVSIQSWHHVAIWWDGTTKQAFLDGAEVARSTAAIDFDGETIRVGGDLDNGNAIAPFPGDLDDIRIYDRAISDVEISALERR
jgi:hypothetical protein